MDSVDGRLAKVIRKALELQSTLPLKISDEKKLLGEGRVGRLVICSSEGRTVISLRVHNGELMEASPEVKVRNEVVFLGIPSERYSGEDVFFDLLRGKVTARAAYSQGWLVITSLDNTGSNVYDSEEMIQILELIVTNLIEVLKSLTRKVLRRHN